MNTLFQRISSTLLFALVAITPIWFLPVMTNSFGMQKQFLFMAVAVLLSALWLFRIVKERRVIVSFSMIGLSAVVLTGAYLASAWMTGQPQAQLNGRFLSIAAMTLVLLFGFSIPSKFTWEKMLKASTLGSILLAVVTWWQYLLPANMTLSGVINSAFGTQFSTVSYFSPVESPLIILAIIIPVILANGLNAWKKISGSDKSRAGLALSTTSVLFLLVTLGLIVFTFITNPEARPVLLPFQQSWGIAVENWKSVQRLFLGTGPEQFLVAFHQLRDVSFNATDLWALRFQTSNSEVLHSLTTVGLIGFAAWMLLYAAGAWVGRKIFRQKPALLIFFAAQFFLFWIMPLAVTTIILLALTLLVISEEARQDDASSAQDIVLLLSAIQIGPSGQLKTKRTSAGFAYATAIVLGIGLLAFSYFAGRIYAAEFLYWRSLQAAQNNNITGTYELQQSAIQLAPYNTEYRRAYSLTNLAIANSLAQNPDITDEQRELLTQLLQQSIREGQLAAQISPQETENWEQIATIYENILDVEGSVDWAQAALLQAIQTDPTSPQLRTRLGNLYLTLQQPAEAMPYFEQAIQLKPDWYVPYFQYGLALQSLEQPQPALAVQAYQQALSLVDPESEDFAVIEQQLAAAQAEADAAEEAGTEEGSEGENQTVDFPDQPTVPENTGTPTGNNPAEELLEAEQNQENVQQNEDGSIVLPDEVGF